VTEVTEKKKNNRLKSNQTFDLTMWLKANFEGPIEESLEGKHISDIMEAANAAMDFTVGSSAIETAYSSIGLKYQAPVHIKKKSLENRVAQLEKTVQTLVDLLAEDPPPSTESVVDGRFVTTHISARQ